MMKVNMRNTCEPFKTKVLTSVTALAILAGASFGIVSEIDVCATDLEETDEIVEEILLEEVISDGEYRVKFVNYNGEELYNESLPVGTFIQEPEIPERIGFTFLGWAPEVDEVVMEQDVVYTAQFVETGGGFAEEETVDDAVVYDSNSNNKSDDEASNNGDFINFVFMVILFLMETVWLHDRRSQQMRRYDAVMSMLDKE